ncbi:hypothetical protein B0H11DRAFT_2277885 [Mycena galericulata]|nr:hypothetical protein B0H11DRAFT_2277885 [Mycena galericulata]
MDSQLTLVAPSPPVCLSFSRDSMKNATLSLGSGAPTYTISTDPQNSCTEIWAAGSSDSEVLVRIAWKPILPDTIAFPDMNGGKEMRLTKWLRKAKLPDGSSVHFIETKHGNFFLKIHPVHRLALFRTHDPETIVAHWRYPTNNDEPWFPALILNGGAIKEADRPQIIAAFILRESRMRMKEEASRIALGSPGGSVVHA